MNTCDRDGTYGGWILRDTEEDKPTLTPREREEDSSGDDGGSGGG